MIDCKQVFFFHIIKGITRAMFFFQKEIRLKEANLQGQQFSRRNGILKLSIEVREMFLIGLLVDIVFFWNKLLQE